MNENLGTILEGLNEQQKKAVLQIEGPVLIVAGAGSGKTKVLTTRIANILLQGVNPSKVMALTFTKKAAGEMKERVALVVGKQRASKLVMGTFHAVFVRFLREFAESLGYPSSFTIYDTSDSTSAMKACVKELGLDDKIYKPKEILSRISKAKNNLITVTAYLNNPQLIQEDMRCKKPKIGELYNLYQTKLKACGVMDFDDILVNMNVLLRDNPAALKSISERFSHVLVDEYQDTNYAQYRIIIKLCSGHRNICVVGDDSQSIYAFRGAKIENILNFRKDFPESKIFRLERNYRSTQNIVDAANSLISKNEGRIPKECFSEGEKGEKIRLVQSFSESDEAIRIVEEIQSKMRQFKAAYQDFAILYRTNAQSRALEEALRSKRIPYIIYSGNSFFDRAEIKDMMAYFKLCVNTSDDESFKRVVNQPARGIGATSLSALNECARAAGCSLFKAAWREDTEIFGLKSAALEKIRAFCKMIDSLASVAPSTDAYDMAKRIADESGLYNFYKLDNSIEGQARCANLDELLDSVASYIEEQDIDSEGVVTLSDYLENVSLLSNVDVSEDDNNKVALMTVHSAKGLEFSHVFIAGMEENLFPSLSMLGSLRDLEEERRLFYVAMTRAKTTLTITYACSRMRNGKHESNSPSRFIKEVNPSYLANPLNDDDFEPAEGGFFGRWNSRSGSSSGGGRPSSSDGSKFFSRRFSGQSSSASSGASFSRLPGRPSGAQKPSLPGARPVAGKPDLIDPAFIPVPMTELFEGERIEHNRFGAGTILSITGNVPELKARINFDIYGEKMLLLKFAKLRPLKK